MQVRAIVTAPPYASFLGEVARHPLCAGFRLNTVMPVKGGPDEALDRLTAFGQPLWVDLKGRQLRVVGAAIPPFTEVTVSHRIRLRTPADAFFNDGREHARVVAVDGDKLILEDSPRRFVGPGESVNIVDPSLEIEGTLTATDRAYLAAMKKRGLHRVMLSFAERGEDLEEVESLLPGAEVVAKIESQKGLSWAAGGLTGGRRLMAARGDLFVEVLRPHRIVGALRQILRADPRAIVASRLFPSLAKRPVPDSPDIGDAAFLLALGYRTFLFGDDVCLRRDSILSALELLEAVAREMDDWPAPGGGGAL
jgi:hypothetical protein